MNKKLKILTIVIIAIVLLGIFLVYQFQEQNAKNVITVNEILNGSYNDGDVIDFEGTITNFSTINSSYGQITIASIDTSIYGFGILINNSSTYSIGDKIRSSLHFKDYEFNGIKILSVEEMHGLYLILPAAVEIAITGSQYVCGGFQLWLESIDGNGKTQYEVINSDDTLSLSNYSLGLYKINLITIADGETFNQNINASTEIFASEYVIISGLTGGSPDMSITDLMDWMPSLGNKSSQNGMIEYVDKNDNSKLDTNDTFNIMIPPTKDKYTIDTYALLITPHDEEKECTVVQYIINWYKGVYSMNIKS